jgi:hypothetical protein
VQYNQQKRLSLEQVMRAATSACQVVDDIIGRRICTVREAVLQRMLDDSCVHLSAEVPSRFQHDAALAAVNRYIYVCVYVCMCVCVCVCVHMARAISRLDLHQHDAAVAAVNGDQGLEGLEGLGDRHDAAVAHVNRYVKMF